MTEDPSRQAFLGAHSERSFALCKVGIVGLSGGGSHVVQQLAHVGILNYVLIDPKKMAAKHLHRLVGGTDADVKKQIPKTKIAERAIQGIRPTAKVEAIAENWQNAQLSLRDCTVIFGCVDSYIEREQLDRFCRRFLIPYIDIGMDVLKFGDSYQIVGQVALSAPGHPCLRCMAIVTDKNLEDDAAQYGAAGSKPQVVWPNGVLASSAVGLFVQLLTPWHKSIGGSEYLEYNGNSPTFRRSPRMEYVTTQSCAHFPALALGDPFFHLEHNLTKRTLALPP